MNPVIHAILPIFALILLGFVARRSGKLGEGAASELNRFVVWLCLPALLFSVTANATLRALWHPGFIAVALLSTLGLFVATVLYRLGSSGQLVDASIEGLGAAYGNTAYIGIPLCLLVFGQEGLESALIFSLVVVCMLFAVAVVCIEVGLQGEKSLFQAVFKVLTALLRNPLVVAPILGVLWNLSGLSIPQPLDKLFQLLGDATTPCALVSIGAFLAMKQSHTSKRVSGLVAIKLVAQPLLAWWLAFHVFKLTLFWSEAAVLLSALPTGTGPYILAELYQREVSPISQTILLSTLGSLLTLPAVLYWING